MSTSEENKCPRCGATISATSTEQLCPACLMSGVLNSPNGADDSIPKAASEIPSFGDPTEFPFECGDYRLLGLLGRGGMGTVYEAEHLPTKRRVALKILGDKLDTTELRQRFFREGRLAASVNHPNTLYIFRSEELGDRPAIAMEVAGGGTLQDRLDNKGPLPVKTAVDAILDVIAGLEAAFEKGVLHRDIKPSNCFVCPDGSVKVGDFGLSVSIHTKDESFVTRHGTVLGTPAFASLEQLRGDAVDLRSDIYSVGATLFALLTGRAPFEGHNAVQVVANAVKKQPTPLNELLDDVPPGLERVVRRCLAKAPDERFDDYPMLRAALLPFSSQEPEPASIKMRLSAAWIDFLIAFLFPYAAIMLLVGAEALLLRPVVDATFFSARYYLAFLGCGFLYFTVAEGLFSGGIGKRLKGLRVIRPGGGSPGIFLGFIRILVPMLSVEGVRMPLMIATISDVNLTGSHIALFVIAANVCGWIPVLLILRARRENGFATVWDAISGTRVIIKPQGAPRPRIAVEAPAETSEAGTDFLGPYRVVREMVPGRWTLASDPVLRRPVWLLRRRTSQLSFARRNLARVGRLRWLQSVDDADTTWDAFEAACGVPFRSVAQAKNPIPWSTLRHWLHDLALELWEGDRDRTLPEKIGFDHVWISSNGHAVLLDEPGPADAPTGQTFAIEDLAGQQRFLSAVAGLADPTSLPVHARQILENLQNGTFEKLSFLTGTLRSVIDNPSDINRGIRAGSVFMLPFYIWVAVFVGYYQAERIPIWHDALGVLMLLTGLAVLSGISLIQLLWLGFRTTASMSIFRLAVVDCTGRPASRAKQLRRWAAVWLPLFIPMGGALVLYQHEHQTAAAVFAIAVLTFWIAAAVYAVAAPRRGLQDKLAGTWLVRR